MVWVQVSRLNLSGCFFYFTLIPGYWKGHSQSQSQGDTLVRELPQQQKQEPRGTQIRQAKDSGYAATESDDNHPPHRNRYRTQQGEGTKDPKATGSTSKQSQPLFFDDDDDSDILKSPKDEDQDENDMTSAHKNQTPATMKSKSSKPIPKKNVTKKAPVIIDDDSDDGVTFKGFRGKNRPLR